MQVWSINWFTRYCIGKTDFNIFYGLVTLKIRSRSPKLINSEPPPNNASVQVWSKSINLFRRYRVGKCNLISFHGLVTLKMRSRSPKSNQLFPPSQPCICASLVKIHPLVQKISRQKKVRGRRRRQDPHQKQNVPHLRLGGHKKLQICFAVSNCTADLQLCFPNTVQSYYYFRTFKLIAYFCDRKGQFVSDLVGNPNCWFSHAKAHFRSWWDGTSHTKDIKLLEVIHLFSCSTQLSVKFQFLINIKIAKIH